MELSFFADFRGPAVASKDHLKFFQAYASAVTTLLWLFSEIVIMEFMAEMSHLLTLGHGARKATPIMETRPQGPAASQAENNKLCLGEGFRV